MRSAAWIAEQFGLDGDAVLEGPVDRGYLGQIWRLTCDGAAFAVKEALAPLHRGQVETAYAFQVRAAALGVVAPRQLVTVGGEPAVYADGETLRAFAWVDLAGPDRALDPAELGRTLAALHRAGGSVTDRADPWFHAPVGRAGWDGLVADLAAAGAPFTGDIADLVDELVAAESIMVEPGPELIMAHRDLWADNLRADASGRLVIIDWDNCGAASANQELAMVLVEFGTTPERARTLYRSYRAADGPAVLTGIGDVTMPLAVMNHLLELGSRQWLAATDDVGRERAAGRVAEFVDDPFLVPEAEQLLAAVRAG